MIMMTAGAMLTMFMVMLMIMMTAGAMLTMFMVMLVIMVTTGTMFIVMMVVMMLQFFQILLQGCIALHGIQQLSTGQFGPGCGDQCRFSIVLTQQRNCCIQFCLGNGIGTGQNNGLRRFDLVVIELAKVLHVDLHLAGIRHSNGVAQSDLLIGDLFHSTDDIGQLANTGGFDDDAVGRVLLDHLSQSLAEVANQTAADAAGVHLGNVDTGILQETTVNADFTELILNQHQLLALIGFLDHLLDQGSFTGTQETGVNIDFHIVHTFCT